MNDAQIMDGGVREEEKEEKINHECGDGIINPFSTSPKIGQVQNFFFFRKFIGSFVFMLERYIKRPFFFLEKTLNFFSYMSEKTERSSQK